MKTQRLSKKHLANKQSIGGLFAETVAKHPHKVAMIDAETGSSLTFGQAEQLANQVGNFFSSTQYEKEDVIAIFMASSPEYVCYWLGLSKIGVISALINFNLRGDSLAHCIKVSKAKTIVYSQELAGIKFSANFHTTSKLTIIPFCILSSLSITKQYHK